MSQAEVIYKLHGSKLLSNFSGSLELKHGQTAHGIGDIHIYIQLWTTKDILIEQNYVEVGNLRKRKNHFLMTCK